jgi:hypothetical protein
MMINRERAGERKEGKYKVLIGSQFTLLEQRMSQGKTQKSRANVRAKLKRVLKFVLCSRAVMWEMRFSG